MLQILAGNVTKGKVLSSTGETLKAFPALFEAKSLTYILHSQNSFCFTFLTLPLLLLGLTI